MTIADEVLIGHGVMFINDRYPHATTANDGLQTHADWELLPPRIRRGARIGSGAVVLAGIEVGERAIVGVTRNVAADKVVAGVPARVLERRR